MLPLTIDRLRTEADRQSDYRDGSSRNAAGPTMIPAKICSRCGISKSIIGGRQRAAIKGPVTRFNPVIFVCAACVEGEQ